MKIRLLIVTMTPLTAASLFAPSRVCWARVEPARQPGVAPAGRQFGVAPATSQLRVKPVRPRTAYRRVNKVLRENPEIRDSWPRTLKEAHSESFFGAKYSAAGKDAVANGVNAAVRTAMSVAPLVVAPESLAGLPVAARAAAKSMGAAVERHRYKLPAFASTWGLWKQSQPAAHDADPKNVAVTDFFTRGMVRMLGDFSKTRATLTSAGERLKTELSNMNGRPSFVHPASRLGYEWRKRRLGSVQGRLESLWSATDEGKIIIRNLVTGTGSRL